MKYFVTWKDMLSNIEIYIVALKVGGEQAPVSDPF